MNSNFHVAQFQHAQHATILNDWLCSHGWKGIPESVLPEGRVAYRKDRPVAMGFFYIDPLAKVCFISFLVADPICSTATGFLGVREVVRIIIEEAKVRFDDHGIIYEVTKSAPIQKLLLKMGFEVGETNTTTLVYSLGGVSTDSFKEG